MDFKKVKPELLSVANFLRSHITATDAISIERRVEIFEAKSAMELLLSPAYAAHCKRSKQAPKVTDPESAKAILKRLVMQGFFVKAVIKGTKALPPSAFQQAVANAEAKAAVAAGGDAAPPPPPPVVRIIVVEPEPGFSWSDEGHYIWVYEGSKVMSYIYSFSLLAIILALVMYPLWPYSFKSASWYVAMLGVGLIGSLFLLAIVRVILYAVSRVFTPGLWLFPNLFEDCGFFESFVPLYGWESQTVRQAKAD